jgi:glycosyltransferase involved in cell wall biosynthesis
VSEAVARPLREAGITVTVVRNGTTFPIEPAPLDHAGPPVVGVNALLTSWKGQDVLLDAVGRLDRGDVLVELLGGSFPKDREYVQRLRERTTRPDLVGRVRFLGKVDDPLARMRGWSISVLPSVDPEAAPLSLLEAMSIGIPAVATNHGGAAEVLGDAGLLVAPRDPDALAAAIGHLVDDRDLRRRCAQAGPRLIAAGLTLEAQEQAFLRVLEAVTDRAPVG